MTCTSFLWIVSLSVLLAACGGGGGDTGTNGISSKAYAIGGQVTELNATGLVLQLNDSSDLAVEAFNPNFVFTKVLNEGSAYNVSVRTNPTGQICNVEKNATGITGASSLSSVVVKCFTPEASNYTIGGAVSGLTETGLILSNGSEQIVVAPNATQFQFPTPLKSGESYDVNIEAQPSKLTCAILNNSGLVNKGTITTVSINCIPTMVKVGFNLNKSTLDFVAEQGAPLAEQILIGTIAGVTEPINVVIEHTNNAIRDAYFSPISENSGQLVVVPQYSANKVGIIKDNITVKVCFQTDVKCIAPIMDTPKIIPVVTEIRPPHPAPNLVLSSYGVALTSVPNHEKLTHTLKVTQSLGQDINWSASSNQPWLSVTSAGKSTDALIIKANTTGLTAGQHYAEVIVSTSDAELTSQKVRVGFYVSSAKVAQGFEPEIDVEEVSLYVDPIRPYIYNIVTYTVATTEEGSVDKPFEILVHNIYTGKRVAKIKVPSGRYGYDMGLALSSDGSYLYATDTIDHVIDVFSLDTLKRVNTLDFSTYQNSADNRGTRIVYSHVQGRPVIILNSLNLEHNNHFRNYFFDDSSVFLNPFTGEVLGQLLYLNSDLLPGGNRFHVVSPDGNVLYHSVYGLSGYLPPAIRFDLKVNSKGNIYGVRTADTGDLDGESPFIFATNNDGSKAYSDRFVILENINGILKPKTMTPASTNRYLLTSKFDPNGNFLCSVFDDKGFPDYMEILDESFKSLRRIEWIEGLGGMRSVYFSSDGLRVFNRSNLRDY